MSFEVRHSGEESEAFWQPGIGRRKVDARLFEPTIKVVEASVDFNKDTTGKIISLTLHQGGRDIEGQKIK